MCCQLEISATVQESPTECVLCVLTEICKTFQDITSECDVCVFSVRDFGDGLGECFLCVVI